MKLLNTYQVATKFANQESTNVSEFDMNNPIPGGNMPDTNVPAVTGLSSTNKQPKTQMKSPLQLGNPNYRSQGAGNTSTKT